MSFRLCPFKPLPCNTYFALLWNSKLSSHSYILAWSLLCLSGDTRGGSWQAGLASDGHLVLDSFDGHLVLDSLIYLQLHLCPPLHLHPQPISMQCEIGKCKVSDIWLANYMTRSVSRCEVSGLMLEFIWHELSVTWWTLLTFIRCELSDRRGKVVRTKWTRWKTPHRYFSEITYYQKILWRNQQHSSKGNICLIRE